MDKTSSFAGRETVVAPFAMATITAGDHQFIPGIRFEGMRREASAQARTATTTPGPATVVVDNAADGDGSTRDALPSVHWRWTLGEHWALRAGGAKLLHRPKWGDLSPLVTTNSGTLANPDSGGNPELDAERAWAAEAGIQIEHRDLGIEGGITVWRRWLDDVIQARTGLEGSRYVSRPQNVGDGWMRGIEVDLRLGLDPLIPGCSPWGNWALMSSSVDDPVLGDIPLQEQHRWAWTIGLDQRFGSTGLSGGVAYNVRGPSSKMEPAKIEEEGAFGLLDAYAAWSWRHGWELRLACGNLTDAKRERDSLNTANGDRTWHTEDAGPTWSLTLSGEW